MDVAFNFYGGISEQVPCNVHPYELAALNHWAAIYCLTPDNYEPVTAWQAFWSLNTDGSAIRREIFEKSYGFVFTERFDPFTQQFVDAIEVGNADFFDYVCHWLFDLGGNCDGLSYPMWP